jgi:hypothetical protein
MASLFNSDSTWQLSVENQLVSFQGLPCDFLVSKIIRPTMAGMPVGQHSTENTVAELHGAMSSLKCIVCGNKWNSTSYWFHQFMFIFVCHEHYTD